MITNSAEFKNNKMLIATGNSAKFNEISKILSPLNIIFESPSKYNIKEPLEDGDTFAKNSLIKARHYAKSSNLISIADDSGISIPILDNFPGIYSARFAINELTNKIDFNHAFDKINQMLIAKNIELNNKIAAFFTCNITIYNPITNNYKSFEGRVDGTICHKPKGNLGFGYDPIFTRKNDQLTFGQIDPKIKDQISHRAIAIKKLLQFYHS